MSQLRGVSRRTVLTATGVAVAGLAGCAGPNATDSTDGSDDSEAVGLLSTAVTDQPTDISDFESCVVTLDGIWIGPEGGADDSDEEDTDTANETESADNETESADNETDSDDADGRTYYAFEEPQEVDLVNLQGDAQEIVDEDREVSVGEYPYLQLDVAGVEGTLTDGTEATVETPGEAPLKFNQSFEIREDTRTSFVADFTPVQRGPPGSSDYIIQPVADGVEVTYESVEEEESEETNTNETDGEQNATENESTAAAES